MKHRLLDKLSIMLAAVMLFALFGGAIPASAAYTPLTGTFVSEIKVNTSAKLVPGIQAKIFVWIQFDEEAMDVISTDFKDFETYNSAGPDKAVVTLGGFFPASVNLCNPSEKTTTVEKISDGVAPDSYERGWVVFEYEVEVNASYSGNGINITIKVEFIDETVTVPRNIPVDNGKTEPPTIIIPDPGPGSDPSPSEPNYTPASISIVPATVTLRAGQTGKFSVEVVNGGERAANNLKGTLTPVGPELHRLLEANPPAAFVATISTLRRNVSGASGGNRGTLEYSLNVPNTIKGGIYEFRLGGSFTHESTNNLGTFEGSVQVVVINDFEPASMQITEVGPLYPVKPGELFNLNIQVRNTGGLAARDVVLSVKNASENSFSMVGSSTAGMLGTVAAGQTGNRTITVRAASKMEAGFWPLIISVSYVDSGDNQRSADYEAVVEILEIPEPPEPPDPPESEVELSRAVIPGGIIEPGQKTVLTIELRNPSEGEAENVRLRVSGFTGTGLYLADGEDNLPGKYIESLKPGERASVMYDVILSDMCSTPALALQAEITYKAPDGKTYTITENISFPVLLPEPSESPSPEPSPSPTPSSVPKLIIDRYEMHWDDIPIHTLRAGAMFDLTFTLRNTSRLTGLSNITVTLSSVDGAFMPAAGSNTFYIDSIPASGEIQRTIRLVVSQSAESKSYELHFSLDYEDKDGGAYRPNETLSLPVVVPLIVELANFNPPMWAEMGMQTYLMFQYINKGKSTVYNFTIDIEGDFMAPDGSSNYVGNLVSGYTDYFECMLIPMSVGELPGAVVLRFEDAVGNITEMREEFLMTVNEPFYPDFPFDDFPGRDPMDSEEGEGAGWFGLAWWVIIACGAGIVAVVLLVTTLLIRRSRKKKRMELYESDDYEGYDEAD